MPTAQHDAGGWGRCESLREGDWLAGGQLQDLAWFRRQRRPGGLISLAKSCWAAAVGLGLWPCGGERVLQGTELLSAAAAKS